MEGQENICGVYNKSLFEFTSKKLKTFLKKKKKSFVPTKPILMKELMA